MLLSTSKAGLFSSFLIQVTHRRVISSFKHPGEHIHKCTTLSTTTKCSWQLGGGKRYWQPVFKISNLSKVQKHIINGLPDATIFSSAGPFCWWQVSYCGRIFKQKGHCHIPFLKLCNLQAPTGHLNIQSQLPKVKWYTVKFIFMLYHITLQFIPLFLPQTHFSVTCEILWCMLIFQNYLITVLNSCWKLFMI